MEQKQAKPRAGRTIGFTCTAEQHAAWSYVAARRQLRLSTFIKQQLDQICRPIAAAALEKDRDDALRASQSAEVAGRAE